MALRHAWRLVKARHSASAFDGEGARLHGGRWSSPGTRIVYTAESPSLAVLEVLVHLQATAPLAAYVMFEVAVSEDLIETLARPPAGWRRLPAPDATRRVGDAWAHAGRSAVLSVPSVVSPGERLLLLNPAHPGFRHVRIGKPQPFPLDPRLGPR
jgi:RES domain-containing protein